MVRRDASGTGVLEGIAGSGGDPHRELASQVLGLIRTGLENDERARW
jgi:hypothetical protein